MNRQSIETFDAVGKDAAEKKELRSFGLIFAVILIGLFGLLIPWLRERPLPSWPFGIAGVFVVLALVFPLGLKPFFKIWMKFGAVMGFINTRIILAVFFFILVTPLGWLMRALKHDPMRRGFEQGAASYRIISKAQTKADLEKPY
ncbi:MAG: SxtJ family membrane protein [Spongiibacteraceae bacterium]